MGGDVELSVKRGMVERAVFWFACIGDPGSAKSPAQSIVLQPVYDAQQECNERYKTKMDEWNRRPKSEKDSGQPEVEVLLTSDTTIEAVVRHHQNSRGLLIAPDELTSWLAGFMRYRGPGASERSNWLSGWALTALHVIRASKAPVFVARPAISVVGGIQPDRLRSLIDDGHGVAMSDGFLGRFLVTWPEAQRALWTETEIPAKVQSEWRRLIRDIIGFRTRKSGDPWENPQDVTTTTFTTDSMRMWRLWYNDNEASRFESGGLIQEWSAKAPRHLARLALVLHIGNHPNDPDRPIDASTLEAAVKLIEYFREENSKMVFWLGQDAAYSRPAGLGARIVRQILKAEGEWVSRSTVYAGLGNVSSSDLDVGIESLIKGGELETRSVETAAKARTEYRMRSA